MRSFRSDNNAGLCPEAIDAIIKANDGSHSHGYGEDEYTPLSVAALHDLFGDDAGVWFVATGTAANVLSIASLTEPWQRILCQRFSHYNEDESTAPERITHCRTAVVETELSKISVEHLRCAVAQTRGDVHQPQPGVLTISNPTEFGEVYTPDEVAALCDIAHEAGYRVHVDGARFANAVASVSCDPRDLTCSAGVDALSFGGTKNGLACSEAVLFFPQGDGSAFERAQKVFEYHRKGTGHLISKHRFVSVPFASTLRDGVWLKHAGHANEMAQLLAGGLRGINLEPAYPVQANGVFVRLPEAVHEALTEAGHEYYQFSDAGRPLYRLMCSFDTQTADVDGFLADARAATDR